MDDRLQTLVFIRHGVARHNFEGADLRDPALFDPPLVPEGRGHVAMAGHSIRRFFQVLGREIGVVLTSPLTRCLQTSSLAFLPGDDYSTERTKIVCCEELREAYGVHYPDKRRSKSDLEVRGHEIRRSIVTKAPSHSFIAATLAEHRV